MPLPKGVKKFLGVDPGLMGSDHLRASFVAWRKTIIDKCAVIGQPALFCAFGEPSHEGEFLCLLGTCHLFHGILL